LDYIDFSSFSKSRTQVKTNDCKIIQAKWSYEPIKQFPGIEIKSDRMVFTIKANRFLRGMVRAIVGTIIEVGRKKITIDEFRKIIDSRSRPLAAGSVPAHGLYLVEVVYPGNIMDEK